MQRDDGVLDLQALGEDRRYRWNAEGFALDGLQVILAEQSHADAVSGRLTVVGICRSVRFTSAAASASISPQPSASMSLRPV